MSLEMKKPNFPFERENEFMREHLPADDPHLMHKLLADTEESKEDARKQNILAFAKVVRQLPPNWNLLS